MQNQNAIAEFVLRLLDLGGLLFVIFHAQSAGDAETHRMIGESNHFDATLGGGLRHLQHRQLAIAPIGMNLQIGFDIFDFDQLRKFVLFRGLHFAAVFTQLRRNPRQAKRLINFFFGRTKNFLTTFDLCK